MFPMNFVNLSGQLGLMTMIVIGVPVEPSRCGSSCTPRTTGPSIIDVPWMPTEFPEGHGTLILSFMSDWFSLLMRKASQSDDEIHWFQMPMVVHSCICRCAKNSSKGMRLKFCRGSPCKQSPLTRVHQHGLFGASADHIMINLGAHRIPRRACVLN